MLKLFRKRSVLNKSAHVYRAAGALIFVSNHEAPNGIKFFAAPIIRLPGSAEDSNIGESIRKVLGAYKKHKNTSELPDDMKAYMKGILKEMGFRSWKALESPPTQICSITASADTITFKLMQIGLTQKDSESARTADVEPVTLSAGSNNSELGTALINTFNHHQDRT